MSQIVMNTIGNVLQFQSTDGKNLADPVEGMEWVRISEKKIGKGKGKTVAAISVMSIPQSCPLFADAFNAARKEMLTAYHRAGKKTVTIEECGFEAVSNWYTAQSFSPESIAQWFTEEMGEYLTMNICIAKGWDSDNLTGDAEKYVENKLVAYKAAFMECGAKFPKLTAEQKKELIRVIQLNELKGGIVDKIVEKISEKAVQLEEALGF